MKQYNANIWFQYGDEDDEDPDTSTLERMITDYLQELIEIHDVSVEPIPDSEFAWGDTDPPVCICEDKRNPACQAHGAVEQTGVAFQGVGKQFTDGEVAALYASPAAVTASEIQTAPADPVIDLDRMTNEITGHFHADGRKPDHDAVKAILVKYFTARPLVGAHQWTRENVDNKTVDEIVATHNANLAVEIDRSCILVETAEDAALQLRNQRDQARKLSSKIYEYSLVIESDLAAVVEALETLKEHLKGEQFAGWGKANSIIDAALAKIGKEKT